MSIDSIIASARLANNGRLLSTAMTGKEIEAAEQAVTQNLLKKYKLRMAKWGYVTAYQL